jgi:hypothetical protein
MILLRVGYRSSRLGISCIGGKQSLVFALPKELALAEYP